MPSVAMLMYIVTSKGDQMQRDRDVSLGMHEAYHHNDMQVIMSLTSVTPDMER